jgi:hypothetical protein
VDSDLDFREFLITRNKATVKRERFTPSIRTSLDREYDNTTQKNLAFIRATTPKTVTIGITTTNEYYAVATRYFKSGWAAALNEVVLQAANGRLDEFLPEQMWAIAEAKVASNTRESK